MERIAVYGLGHLGLPLATVFARTGFETVGVDPKVAKIGTNNWSNQEPHLYFDDRLSFSDVPTVTDISFIVVPTPSLKDGSFDHMFVFTVLQEIEQANESDHTAVIVSTVSPGTCKYLQNRFPTLRIVYNPTFIAIGNVIMGLLRPDMILIGDVSERPDQPMWRSKAAFKVQSIWHTVFRERAPFEKPPVTHLAPYTEIELIKLSVNAALGTKISMANSLGQLFEAHGVDPAAVSVIGNDHRIGKDFLVPGGPITGPCLPRDNYALRRAAKEVNLTLPISSATDKVNIDLFWRICNRIKDLPVGILGMSYKYGTDLNDYSVGHWLEIQMEKEGTPYFTYDDILPSHTLEEVLDCKTIVVTQKEYRHQIEGLDPSKEIIDVWS